jgi:hypothetical protein
VPLACFAVLVDPSEPTTEWRIVAKVDTDGSALVEPGESFKHDSVASEDEFVERGGLFDYEIATGEAPNSDAGVG